MLTEKTDITIATATTSLVTINNSTRLSIPRSHYCYETVHCIANYVFTMKLYTRANVDCFVSMSISAPRARLDLLCIFLSECQPGHNHFTHDIFHRELTYDTHRSLYNTQLRSL